MPRFSLASWCSRFLRPRAGKNRPLGRGSSVRLGLEALEDRLTPTIQPFTLQLQNLTGLPLTASADIWVAGYTNTEHLHLNSAGNFVADPAPGPGATLPSFHFSDLPGGKVNLAGGQSLTSARIVLMYGAQFSLTRNDGSDWDGPAPSTFPTEPYDFVEFTLNDTGLFINTTQVDQFGFPITLTGDGQSVGVDPRLTREQLIQAYVDHVKAEPDGSSFADLAIPAPSPVNDYRIVSPGLATNFEWGPYMNGPIRQLFENPGTKLNIQSSVLAGAAFVDYTGEATTYNPFTDPTPPTNNTKVVANNRNYNVLKFTPTSPVPAGANPGPFYVYEPFWKDNTKVDVSQVSVTNNVVTVTTASDHGIVLLGPKDVFMVNIEGMTHVPNGQYQVTSVPNSTSYTFSLVTPDLAPTADSGDVWFGAAAAPSWITSASQQNITPGQMVFSGNGVFADQGTTATPGQDSGMENTPYQLILANFENQLVTALNRGVANLDYTKFTSAQASITQVSFVGSGGVGNRFAAFTTSTPHGFAPSIGEFVTISGLADQNGIPFSKLNQTFSINNVLTPTTFTVALAPTDPFDQSQPFFTVSGTEQLTQNSSGGDAGIYPNTTWFWVDGNHFYPQGVRQNLYAEGLHNMTVNIGGQNISPFISKLVYALSFDDQGASAPALSFANTSTVNVTLGPWAKKAVSAIVVVGPDQGFKPVVKVFDAATQTLRFQLRPYAASFRGGVRVASGDVNGDRVADFVTAPGPGMAPVVKLYDGATGQLIVAFHAYSPKFRGGVFVAVGDLDGDGKCEILVGPGKGALPIRAYNAQGNALPGFQPFFPYGKHYAGGMHVALGNADGVGPDEIAVAPAGPGRSVRLFNAAGKLLRNFAPYPNLNFKDGIWVALGDVNGDGRNELITGPGIGAMDTVRIFDTATGKVVRQFAAFPGFKGGTRVSVADANGDAQADLIAARGPGGIPFVKLYVGIDIELLKTFPQSLKVGLHV